MKMSILGAGGHGQVIASVLASSNIQYKYYDDKLDYPRIEDCSGLFIVGIGDNETRARIYDACKGTPRTIGHRSMTPLPCRMDGRGTFVNAGVIINTGARIGDNVILNTGCIIEHHCIVHDHAHIAPGAVLLGAVEIGEGALVGAGAVVLPGVKVPEWITVRAGSVYGN